MSRVKAVWRLLTMSCEGITRLSSESLDRDLCRLEKLALHSHLLGCTACRRYKKQVEFLGRALGLISNDLDYGETLPGPRLPEEARIRMKRALEEN